MEAWMIAVIVVAVLVLIAIALVVQRRKARAGGIIAADADGARGGRS